MQDRRAFLASPGSTFQSPYARQRGESNSPVLTHQIDHRPCAATKALRFAPVPSIRAISDPINVLVRYRAHQMIELCFVIHLSSALMTHVHSAHMHVSVWTPSRDDTSTSRRETRPREISVRGGGDVCNRYRATFISMTPRFRRRLAHVRPIRFGAGFQNRHSRTRAVPYSIAGMKKQASINNLYLHDSKKK